jgi:hypothetical protein
MNNRKNSEADAIVVEILSYKKPSNTQRSGELRFYFMPVAPDELTVKIHRILKG